MNHQILFLICLVSCSATPYQCLTQLSHNYQTLATAFKETDPNQTIDIIRQMAIQLPSTLTPCAGQKITQNYQTQVPPICINELAKAAKLLNKMNKETNQVRETEEALMLESLFQTKIKKHCPFIQEMKMQDIKSGGVCMEASYQLSLIFQQIVQDFKAGNKQSAYNNIDTFFTILPDVLQACGQKNWADLLRKYLPMQCVHALELFGKELASLQGHFMHWEWVFKHYKQITESWKKVTAMCPSFKGA